MIYTIGRPHPNGTRGMHEAMAANARRIVACVNACEGLDIDDLESGDADPLDAASWRRPRQDYKAQRDELLAALEACVADGFLAGEVLDQAAAAIAKCKGA